MCHLVLHELLSIYKTRLCEITTSILNLKIYYIQIDIFKHYTEANCTFVLRRQKAKRNCLYEFYKAELHLPAIFLSQIGVFCLFLAVAQRLSNQWPYNISVILHHKQ